MYGVDTTVNRIRKNQRVRYRKLQTNWLMEVQNRFFQVLIKNKWRTFTDIT